MTTTTGLRRCIGSARFGIGAHEVQPSDFPAQPSQRDGLGRMCKPHWNQYTHALRKASVAREAAVESTPEPIAEPTAPTPPKGRRAKAAPEPETDAA